MFVIGYQFIHNITLMYQLDLEQYFPIFIIVQMLQGFHIPKSQRSASCLSLKVEPIQSILLNNGNSQIADSAGGGNQNYDTF